MANFNDVLSSSARLKKMSSLVSPMFKDEVYRDYPRLPSYVFGFDFATAGGLPCGVMTHLYGLPASGKSTFTHLMAKAVQKTCMNCLKPLSMCSCENQQVGKVLYVLTEGNSIDESYLLKLGVDVKYLPDGSWDEDRNNIIRAMPEYGEQACDIIMAAVQADDISLIIVDSIVGITSKAILESDFEDRQYGGDALLIGKLTKKLNLQMIQETKRGHKVSIIFLNQLRAKMNASLYEEKEQTPGGYALRHACRLSINASRLSADPKERDADAKVNYADKFKLSMVGQTSKQQIFLIAGQADYRVVQRPFDGYEEGTILDANECLAVAKDRLGIFVKEGGVYTLMGLDWKFLKQDDFKEVFRTGQYIDPDTVEVTEGADDIIKYTLVQVARSVARRNIEEKYNKKVITIGSKDAPIED